MSVENVLGLRDDAMDTASRAERPQLVELSRGQRRPLARVPFLGVLAVVLGLGMAGLLLLNTALQSQSFELRQLNSQVRDLSNSEAALQAELDQLGSTRNLTRQASDLGMRPRDRTAFVELPSGKIIGKPQRSGRSYSRAFLDRSPAAVEAERQTNASKRAQQRIESEQRSRAQRRAEVQDQQVRDARQQAARDRDRKDQDRQDRQVRKPQDRNRQDQDRDRQERDRQDQERQDRDRQGGQR